MISGGVLFQRGALPGLSIELPKLFLGLLQNLTLVAGKIPAGTVDIKIQHGHGGAEWRAFAAFAAVGRPFERLGDFTGITPGKNAWLQIKSIAVFGDLLGPAFHLLFGLFVYL